MTAKSLIAILSLLFMISGALLFDGEGRDTEDLVYQETNKPDSSTDRSDVASVAAQQRALSFRTLRSRVPTRLLAQLTGPVEPCSSVAWTKEGFFSTALSKQDLYRRYGIYRI